MKQMGGALLRLGRVCAGSSSQLLRSNPGPRPIDFPRKQWMSSISPLAHEPRVTHQPLYAAHFSSAATSSKDGESPAAEEKAEPVSKKGDEKKVNAKAEGGKDGEKKDAEKKPGAAAADEKKVPDTPEQKLLKEVKKLEQVLREKESILEEKDEQVKELKDNVLRAYAELENFRERSKREQESSRKFAVQSFAKDLLDVSDNLSRALSSTGQPKEAEDVKKTLDSLLEGVKMTEKQLLQVLKKFGVERFDPTGQAFDPNVHLAVCEVADPSKPAGTVANVFKVGYLLHERVLRPAEVAVVKAAEAAA